MFSYQLVFIRLLILLVALPNGIPFYSDAYDEEPIFSNLPEDSRRIFLESKYSYSVTLKLHKREHHDENSGDRTIDYHVRAPDYSYYGIMAIVQNLYLRKHKLESKAVIVKNDNVTSQVGESRTCRDYIQFFKQNGNKSSSKICGSLYKGDFGFNSSELIGPRVFYSEYGALKLRFHVDSNIFDYDEDDPYLVGVEIAFSAYTVCPNTNVGIRTLKRCSNVESISCISSSLFCDGKIDCGFANEFGVDETSCFTSKYYKHGIVLLIFIFFLCLLAYSIVVRLKKKNGCA